MRRVRQADEIRAILKDCGYPGRLFEEQSELMAYMLLEGEEPLCGCIGRQYSPPPESDVPMLILATNIRVLVFDSKRYAGEYRPAQYPYQGIDTIVWYGNSADDGEIRLRLTGNRRWVAFNRIVTPIPPVMGEIGNASQKVKLIETASPLGPLFTIRERVANRLRTVLKRTEKPFASSVLTNVLLALTLIAQAIIALVAIVTLRGF